MANVKEAITYAGQVDPKTIEVGYFIYNPEFELLPIGIDWENKSWHTQYDKVALPDGVTIDEAMRLVAKQRGKLKKGQVLGPSLVVRILEGKAELVQEENALGIWSKMRDIEPIGEVVADTVTVRRMKTNDNLLGQYSQDGKTFLNPSF